MYPAVVAMPSKFNISHRNDSHRQNRFPYKISLERYLPDDNYHLNYQVEELYLKLNTLFASVLLLFATSTMFITMVSGFWSDLKSFVPA